jgi:hypothetical protein
MIANIKKVSNLGFAGYLVLLGHEFIEPPKKEIDGKFAFTFDLSEESFDSLMARYCTSDFAKFDSIIVNLKRMLPRY